MSMKVDTIELKQILTKFPGKLRSIGWPILRLRNLYPGIVRNKLIHQSKRWSHGPWHFYQFHTNSLLCLPNFNLVYRQTTPPILHKVTTVSSSLRINVSIEHTLNRLSVQYTHQLPSSKSKTVSIRFLVMSTVFLSFFKGWQKIYTLNPLKVVNLRVLLLLLFNVPLTVSKNRRLIFTLSSCESVYDTLVDYYTFLPSFNRGNWFT